MQTIKRKLNQFLKKRPVQTDRYIQSIMNSQYYDEDKTPICVWYRQSRLETKRISRELTAQILRQPSEVGGWAVTAGILGFLFIPTLLGICGLVLITGIVRYLMGRNIINAIKDNLHDAQARLHKREGQLWDNICSHKQCDAFK